MDVGSKAEAALRMVREAKEIAFDTETSGLDWRINQPIGYVVTDDNLSVYVPVRHGGGGNLMGCRPLKTPHDPIEVSDFERELAKAFKDRMATPGLGRVVGHHMKFDVHMAANASVMLGRNLACTQNMHAMLDEYSKSFSLENCATAAGVKPKLGDDLYKAIASEFGGNPDRKQMEHFWRMPGNHPHVMDYAEGDGISTLQLWRVQMQQIAEQEMDLIAGIENDLIWTIFRMERRGIRVDEAEVSRLREATEAEIRGIMATMPMGLNVRSPAQVEEYMVSAGHMDWPQTDKGNPSFTEKWLKKTPEGQKIIRIRQMSNLINSFIDPLMTRHVHEGRVHATLNQLKADLGGTISGRFSCQNPNLQQVPKRMKNIAKPFRRIFVADEGYIFWERDYSQCEPRLFAHYSGDTNLVEGYNSEPFVDAHQVVANLLNVERDPTAKRMNMGIFTGMQVRTFADHMGWPESKAAEAWHKWYGAFPGVKDFQYKAKMRLQNRGWVKTILGRRCRLEHPRFAYRGTSKIIQGSNADIIKLKLLEAERRCEDAGDIVQIHMTVHDSFNGQFQDTPEARALFEEIMADMAEVQVEPYNLRVPFLLEGHEGRNWSEATFGVEA
jgi:DNA polymerase I-like protein with 3'-5' exonuclease and polymerase domains